MDERKALPYTDVPAALTKIRGSTADPSTRLYLEFLILTAVRSGEARMARWSEVDWQERSWTIPLERMKAAREHSVPLSQRAVEVLREARELSGSDELIFRASRRSEPLSDMTLLRLLQRLEVPCVVHGFRYSFRTWAGDLRVADSDVCEAALAHQIDDETEKVYVRSEFFDLRRNLMERWAEYLTADAP